MYHCVLDITPLEMYVNEFLSYISYHSLSHDPLPVELQCLLAMVETLMHLHLMSNFQMEAVVLEELVLVTILKTTQHPAPE